MKKILVPTDFSEHAENALKVAAELARQHHAEIVLLHNIELPPDMTNPVGATRSSDVPEVMYFMKLARKKFSEILSEPYLQGLTVHETVEFEQAFNGILRQTEKSGCDFIVMGSKGATGLKEMFVGSNTEKVVRHSEIPVLVVKKDQPNFRFDKFVFATNLEEHDKKTLEKVVEFVKQVGSRLYLVFINTANEFVTSEQIDNRLRDHLENIDFQDYEFHVHNDKNVEQGILNFSSKIGADVVGLATHGRKGLSHFFNGSISEDLVNHTKIPVVTFRLEIER